MPFQVGNTLRLKHGGKGSREYRIWKNMRNRCNNPNFRQHKDYAARGISICTELADFACFLADMGPCPPGLTWERVNNDKGYSKANCVWATRAAQNRNRLVTFRGETLTISGWAERLGVKRQMLRNRIHRRGADATLKEFYP